MFSCYEMAMENYSLYKEKLDFQQNFNVLKQENFFKQNMYVNKGVDEGL